MLRHCTIRPYVRFCQNMAKELASFHNMNLRLARELGAAFWLCYSWFSNLIVVLEGAMCTRTSRHIPTAHDLFQVRMHNFKFEFRFSYTAVRRNRRVRRPMSLLFCFLRPTFCRTTNGMSCFFKIWQLFQTTENSGVTPNFTLWALTTLSGMCTWRIINYFET